MNKGMIPIVSGVALLIFLKEFKTPLGFYKNQDLANRITPITNKSNHILSSLLLEKK